MVTMREEWKQLCMSPTAQGIYDEQILDLLCSGECGADIMRVIMTLTSGRDNPALVDVRIKELRSKI